MYTASFVEAGGQHEPEESIGRESVSRHSLCFLEPVGVFVRIRSHERCRWINSKQVAIDEERVRR